MVRVRIAPSPTGDPHVGTAYIALFNYAFARKHGGRFLLRIEDTDRSRSSAESERAIFRALRWLGIEWDEGPDVGGAYGPYRQSERSGIYQEHAARLLATGAAYRCWCTSERLEALRAGQRAEGRPLGYDGKCRDLGAAGSDRSGPSVVRFRMPRQGSTTVKDVLRGEVAYENATVDDQILLKSDGFPTYHLANVVDDHMMGITHVIRAEEWLTSTPKHVQLYRSLQWSEPTWVHMPLLRNRDKSKISKRKNPVSLDYYREIGLLPEAMLNFLALMGWSMGGDREKFSLHEMIAEFDIQRVHLGGPVFDLEKLSWLNGLYLREISAPDLLRRLRQWRLGDDYLSRLIPLVQERMRRLDEFVPMTSFFFSGDLDYADAPLVPKGKTAAAAADALEKLCDALDEGPGFSAEAMETLARALATEVGWKTKDLFMVMRVAFTGRAAAPPLFTTMEAIGRETCRRRLRLAVAHLRRQEA